MTDEPTGRRIAQRVSPGGVAAAVLGVALFVFFVQRVGVGEITGGIERLGWLFLVVVALGGLRFAVRAMAWRSCLEGPHRLTPARAFQAVVAGDTLGNLTPLSLLISEPAKALFVRDREPVSRTLSALAVENLFYTLSAALVIAGGALALVLRLRTADTWWLASVGLVAALIILISLVHAVIWRRVRVASGLFELATRRGLAPQVVARWGKRVRRVEDRVYALYPREPGRLTRLACWELSFHALAILEIYLVLSLISDIAPTLLDAFVFESGNRFITTMFKVVPMRIGVDEGGTAAFAELLGFGAAAGVTLAIVRHARMLVWVTVGVGLLLRRGLSVRTAIEAAGAARDARHDESTGRATSGAAVVVMARSPEGARPPKTRLTGVLPDERDRRRLYAAFLSDVVATCRTIDEVTVRVAYTENGGTTGFDTVGVADDELLPQRGADLGERERGVFEDLFRDGFSPVVMVGSDVPTLPAKRVIEALDRLRAPGDRVVLGPANDGGYYLIGLAARTGDGTVPDLFTGVRWSTEWARDDTLRAADRCGLTVELVGDWYDVDDAASLTRLRRELATQDGGRRGPATKRALEELAILGGGLPSP
jgi:rSAM/selenodomain-associated transferase 1